MIVADSGVTLKFFGDTKSAEAAIAKLEQRLQALENAQKQSGARSKESSKAIKEQSSGWDEAGNAVMRYAGGVAIATAALRGTLSVVNAIGDANQKWQNDLSGLDKRLELMQASVILQAGASGDVESQETIRTAARRGIEMPAMGDKLEDFVGAQVYLEGSNLPKEDVKSGKSLAAFNRTLAGVSAFQPGGEFATSRDAMEVLTTMIEGFGKQGSEEDILDVGTAARGAFKNTRMKGGDLKAFAKESATFEKFGVSLEDALSTFATTNEVIGNAESTAVGMRNYLSINSDVTPERTRLIEEGLGVKQSDLSVEKGGTTLDQSLQTLERALAGKSEEESNTLMTGIYGREAATTIQGMLKRRTRGNEVEATMDDREGFMESGDTFAGTALSRRRQRLLGTGLAQAEKVWSQGGVTFDENREGNELRFSKERLSAGRDALGQSIISGREAFSGVQESVAERVGLDPRDTDKVGGVMAQAAVAFAKAVPIFGAMLGEMTKVATNTERNRNRNGNVEDN